MTAARKIEEVERDLTKLLIAATCLLTKLDLYWSIKLSAPAPFNPEREELRRVLNEIARGSER
jgi:hypothetical protein